MHDVFNVTARVKNMTFFKEQLPKLETTQQHLVKKQQDAQKTMKEVTGVLEKVNARVDQTKEISEGLMSPLRRAWQTQKIRERYRELTERDGEKNVDVRGDWCEQEQRKGLTVVNAVELEGEVDVTKCMLRNRDELVEAFCNFKDHIDRMLVQGRVKKTATDFFPNICCDKIQTCDRSQYDVKEEELVPFALAQGGKVTHATVFDEVHRTLGEDGYLHKGVLDLLDALKHMNVPKMSPQKEQVAKKDMATFFRDISFCGPRIFSNPTTSDASGNYMCQLFTPYRGLMKKLLTFHASHFVASYVAKLHRMFQSRILSTQSATSSLVEKAAFQMSLRQHASSGTSRSHRSGKSPMQKVISTKTKSKRGQAEPKCSASYVPRHYTKAEAVVIKDQCTLHAIDLDNPKSQSFGIYFVKPWMNLKVDDYEFMTNAQRIGKYDIEDDCDIKTVLPTDIALQQVKSSGEKNDQVQWAFVAKLNTNAAYGYYQNYMRQCSSRRYLTATKFTVHLFVDVQQCCKGTTDKSRCGHCKLSAMALKCPLDENNGHTVSVEFNMEGAEYEATTSAERCPVSRGHGRRLLTTSRSKGGNS